MDACCQSLTSLCRSLPPLHPSDERMLSMRSFSLQNGRNASVPPSQRLGEEAQAQQAHLSRSTIPEHYKHFADTFSEEAFTHLPPHKAWDHAIQLHPDAKLPRGRTFPLSPAEQKELDEFLKENLVN